MARKRFMRLEASRATQGNGLGLALVKRLPVPITVGLNLAMPRHHGGRWADRLLAEIILPLAEPK